MMDIERMKASWLEAVANGEAEGFSRHFVPDILNEVKLLRDERDNAVTRWRAEITDGRKRCEGIVELAIEEKERALTVSEDRVMKLRQALEHCRNRPHEHNPLPDWSGPTRCEVIDRALE